MKILFVMRHSGYVRNFESTLRLLCDRGHHVHLAFQIAGAHALLDAGDIAQELARQYPRFSTGQAPARDDAWGIEARELRFGLDYLRYLTPAYVNSPRLLARALRDAPVDLVAKAGKGLFASRAGRDVLRWWLRLLHRAVPTEPVIDGFLAAHKPDALVVTPLIEPGAPQAEYIRSARSLGIRTALCVASWDNLTNKGLIHGPVDLVTVWNEMMKQEAVTLHGVPADRVAVTGAQPFDHWFGWQPATTREQFCAQVGLPATRPYVLYLCSSRFIAPEEVPFVRRWLSQMRQSSPLLRDAGVLIRPHPQNADQWREADLAELGPVTVWPAAGQVPVDASSRADYFDSMFHSAAVVGVNTTAEIESAIVGRPVYTVLAPEFEATQEGTPHFAHLQRVNGGLVHATSDLTAHFAEIDATLHGTGAADDRCRRFVDAFVRPFGIDTPSTPRLVDALEALVARPSPGPVSAPPWAWLVRPHLAAAGARVQRELARAAESKLLRRSRKAAAEMAERAEKAQQAEQTEQAEQAVREAGVQPPQQAGRGLTHTEHWDPHSWRPVVAAYQALDSRHRVYFGRATAADVPGELLETFMEHARGERLDYPDAEILLRVSSREERNRLKACAKEPFTVEWIHRWIGAGDVLYDIGANVGAYSLVAAKKPGGGARVFAFEPSAANLAALCANVVLNDVAESVTPLPFALSDQNALSTFALRTLAPGSARHSLGDDRAPSTGDKGGDDVRYRQPVVLAPLDDLVDRLALPAPHHIKLDVDGGELAVLEGAARTLSSPTLATVLVEIGVEQSSGVSELMARHGLTLGTKINVRNKDGECRVWYGLFTRAVTPDRATDTTLQTIEFVAP